MTVASTQTAGRNAGTIGANAVSIERVAPGLDLGRERVEVVVHGRAGRDRRRRRPRRARSASSAIACSVASARAARSAMQRDVALVAHDAAHRRARRPGRGRRGGRRRSGSQPQRGSPTFTSTSTSRIPAAAAASTVASESTATVTRASQSAMARSRCGSTVSLARSRSVAEPGRGEAEHLARRRGGEAGVADGGLAVRERGGLVRLHVRPAARCRAGPRPSSRGSRRGSGRRPRGPAWTGHRASSGASGRWRTGPNVGRCRICASMARDERESA